MTLTVSFLHLVRLLSKSALIGHHGFPLFIGQTKGEQSAFGFLLLRDIGLVRMPID